MGKKDRPLRITDSRSVKKALKRADIPFEPGKGSHWKARVGENSLLVWPEHGATEFKPGLRAAVVKMLQRHGLNVILYPVLLGGTGLFWAVIYRLLEVL